MSSEAVQIQQQGVKWLYEMELLDDPQLINNLKLNLLTISKNIVDVELLSLHNIGRKEMLIWVDLNWWAARFQDVRILAEVLSMVGELLPNFTFRITKDRDIMDKALQNVKNYLTPKAKVETLVQA